MEGESSCPKVKKQKQILFQRLVVEVKTVAFGVSFGVVISFLQFLPGIASGSLWLSHQKTQPLFVFTFAFCFSSQPLVDSLNDEA